MSNRHRSVILGMTSIAFDNHFTIQSIRPLENAILEFIPDAKSAGIKYPVKSKGFGQGFLTRNGVQYPIKDKVDGLCQVVILTANDCKRVVYFRIDGKRVERYIESIPEV